MVRTAIRRGRAPIPSSRRSEMYVRWSLYETLIGHFFIGVGLAGFYVIRCQTRSPRKPRALFRFGGHDPLSLGRRWFWFRWFTFAYLFEVATSFLMGHRLYVDLALSVFEAAA